MGQIAELPITTGPTTPARITPTPRLLQTVASPERAGKAQGQESAVPDPDHAVGAGIEHAPPRTEEDAHGFPARPGVAVSRACVHRGGWNQCHGDRRGRLAGMAHAA